jgi:hypothetical protein
MLRFNGIRSAAVCVAALAALGINSGAGAQAAPPTVAPPANPTNLNAPPPPAPQTIVYSPGPSGDQSNVAIPYPDIASAYARLQASQAAYADAQTAINLAVIRLTQKFNSSDELKSALSDLDAAQDKYDKARAAAIQSVASRDDYQELGRKEKSLDNTLTIDQTMPVGERIDLARQRLAVAAQMSGLEMTALDGNSEYQSARQAMASAGAKVADLRARFKQSIPTDADWLAAHQQLETARIASVAADAYFQGAVQNRIDAVCSDVRHYSYNRFDDPYSGYGYGYGYGIGYGAPFVYTAAYPYNFVAPHPRLVGGIRY